MTCDDLHLDEAMVLTPGKDVESADAGPREGEPETPGPSHVSALDLDGISRPRVKTGLTGTGAMARVAATPPGDITPGLHARAVTPGPVIQQFVNLGRYQLLSRLAVGGMAEVYLARQGELSGFKTLVVVKKVLPHLALKPDFINMFLDEARIASMLDHPNVVRILEVGRTESEYFLAMELVQGKSLASVLQQSERAKTPLPHSLGALLVANAAAGLHHAHLLTDAAGRPLGLVHRDISPQNIMVSFEGAVKVIDFGIARALGRLGDTSSGSLKGKLGYMAPEQARGEPIDSRADIFSLGVVLWECIAGRRLFLRENELATLRAVVYEPIPQVSKYTKVDPVLEVIIEHALARDLEERFQTAEEMRIALERWVFAAGGTSSHDLASLMKSWFPEDHVQWQRATLLALDMQETDPPIDLAFPNLASRQTGSRTGSSHPSGSGRQLALELAAQMGSAEVVALPSLAGSPPQPSPWRGVFVVALLTLLAAAAAAGYFLYWNRPPIPVIVEPASTQPTRPKVEILPVTQPPTNEPASSSKAAPPSVPADQPSTATAEPSTTGKKKYRSGHGDRYGVPHESGESRSRYNKRPTRYDKPVGRKPTQLRPNPF